MTPNIQVLELRVVFLQEGQDDPTLSMLIDGRPVFESVNKSGYQGFDPATMLWDTDALSVTESARRVAMYRCSCGEPGCGVVAPLVSLEGDLVRWSDFRDYTGVFSEPTLDPEQESEYLGTNHGHHLPMDDFSFDRVAYESAVKRARLDHSWESPERVTARIVSDALRADQETFAAEGRRVGWVAYPWWKEARSGWMVETRRRFPDGHVVTWEDDIEQAVAEVSTAPASPDDQAADILRKLRSVPIKQWPEVFPRRD
jgi:hypothetical protein